MSRVTASSALSHLTVLDLTRVRAGPTCCRVFADFGADVIKIEAPDGVDPNEGMSGARHGYDMQNLHRNKRSLTLNLKMPSGLAAFKRLVAKADIVAENYRPDVKERLGIGYDALKAINPRIILVSVSGFGQTGPYAGHAGFDQIAQGMGGLMSITGEPGRGPMRVGIPIADLSAGLFCAMGIMVALLEREHSGKGQQVDTSLLAAQIFMLDFQGARWINEGDVPKQAGNNHPTSIPTGVFKTKDGHINIAASGQPMWERLCHAIGAPKLLDNDAYKSAKLRSQNRHALNADLEIPLAKKSSAHWVEALNAASVPAGPINDMQQVFADPQVQHLGLVDAIDSKDSRGMVKVVRQPVRLSRTPSKTVAAPPERGQHSTQILKEFGFTPEEIKSLRAGGIL